MIGYRPHPSLLGGSGGGSGGAGVDQTARDAVAASDAVNVTQETEIGALKAADIAFATRVATGEAKDDSQDTAISGFQTADTALAGRASALEGRATSGEAKDVSQDADLVAHAGRLAAGETKDASQDTDLMALHGADTTLAGRATALEGQATTSDTKDASQDADLLAHGTRLTSAESKNSAQDTDLAGLHTADTALVGRATALETRASTGETKDATQDADLTGLHSTDVALANRATALEGKASANETKDGSQDTRLSNTEANVQNLQTQVTGLANLKGSVWLGSYRVKANDPKTGFDVMSKAPPGAVEFEVTVVGAGASGMAYAGTAMNDAGHGGLCGAVEGTGRIPATAGTTLDMVIGAGGAAAVVTANGNYAQNSGSNSLVVVKKNDTEINRLTCPGGRSQNALSTQSGSSDIMPAVTWLALVYTIMRIRHGAFPGRGSANTDNLNRALADSAGKVAVNGPGSGGGANLKLATSDGILRGDGSAVRYTSRPEFPTGSLQNVSGGRGAYTAADPGSDGANPTPDVANSYGSGGGGGVYEGASNQQPGRKGGFPGAGGGGAFGNISTSAKNVVSGAGGDAAVDINYFGVPPQ